MHKSGRYGLLGRRLGHSFSPRVHALIGDYDYSLFEKEPEQVQDFLLAARFEGINVTMPYKKTVIPYCSGLSPEAEKIGSVNTLVKLEDGTLFGENTDYFGFSYLLAKADVSLKGKKVVILGNGGAAATVRAYADDADAAEVVNVFRSGNDNFENIERHHDAQIIVNTTPVGMYPHNGESLIDLRGFKSCEAVIDLVSNPLKTELILQAEDLNLICIGGLYMLTAQAVAARALWENAGDTHGRSICQADGGRENDQVPHTRIDAVTELVLREVRNIALIGMPGCGKTSVGQCLAQQTGRDFYDVDELIVRRTGQSVETIFEVEGEDAFRDMETNILDDVSKKSGCIIATGGGVVKREANNRLLRQNSMVIFIDRDAADLPLSGRPLSMSQGIGSLYEERLPLYESWSDVKIPAGESVQGTALAVKERLNI